MTRAGYSDLVELLADAGAVVSGGAALFGTAGFVVAIMARDAGFEVDPVRIAELSAAAGGGVGLLSLVYRLAGVE